ncbi:MAG: hypothetical protein HKM24_00500 [Gammaproteobacteria bacterium]|nr:hypothetical protein [Gammaproteobacteria bacterium]
MRRNESDFDPGAEYRIATSQSYYDQFFATFLQFQLYEALCDKGSGELSNCSIYNSKVAGKALSNMMSVGASQNWRNVLQQVTDKRRVSASAMLEYFRPLQEWLVEANYERSCGWF